MLSNLIENLRKRKANVYKYNDLERVATLIKVYKAIIEVDEKKLKEFKKEMKNLKKLREAKK